MMMVGKNIRMGEGGVASEQNEATTTREKAVIFRAKTGIKISDSQWKDFARIAEEKITAGRKKYAEIDIFDGADGGEILKITRDEGRIARILACAKKIQKQSEVLVCIGTGGSYLGHKALYEVFIAGNRRQDGLSGGVELICTGQNMSENEVQKLFDVLRGKDFSINVISKSGKTLEPRVAFDLFLELLTEKYGADGARERVLVTTGEHESELLDTAKKNGYEILLMPEKIGGRFSVFTEVGLLPLAAAGVNIRQLLNEVRGEISQNWATAKKYALARGFLRQNGRKIEALVANDSSLKYLAEWWKQLFGESEGKTENCLFPTTMIYPRDLHSMGQMMQQGRRDIIETLMRVENLSNKEHVIDRKTQKSLFQINSTILDSAESAHFNKGDGIDVFSVWMGDMNVYSAARMMAFFMRACVYSAYQLGVNPYDQPGVEDYKREMQERMN